MNLLQAAQQTRFFDHEAQLTHRAHTEDPASPVDESKPRRICMVCGLFVQPHPHGGRQADTCGRVACRRTVRKMKRRLAGER